MPCVWKVSICNDYRHYEPRNPYHSAVQHAVQHNGPDHDHSTCYNREHAEIGYYTCAAHQAGHQIAPALRTPSPPQAHSSPAAPSTVSPGDFYHPENHPNRDARAAERNRTPSSSPPERTILGGIQLPRLHIYVTAAGYAHQNVGGRDYYYYNNVEITVAREGDHNTGGELVYYDQTYQRHVIGTWRPVNH